MDQTWRGLMEGMTVEVLLDELQPVAGLRVDVPDQAAQAGLLAGLFGINATVLSVTALEAA